MGEMTEADRKAFEAWLYGTPEGRAWCEASYLPNEAITVWNAALAHARGNPVAWHYLDPYEAYVVSRNHPIKTGENRLATEIRPATVETLMEDREALVQKVAQLEADIGTLRLVSAANALRGKQEPVAWGESYSNGASFCSVSLKKSARHYYPLYTNPPAKSEEISQLQEALEWYGENTRLCRIITNDGDAGRNALANDGGKRARAALAASPAPAMGFPITEQNQSVAPSKPKVKALGPWRRGYCDAHVAIEQASFGGLYQVRVLNGVINLDWPDRSPPSVFGALEEAKAAAQADYERRILSAIEGGEDE